MAAIERIRHVPARPIDPEVPAHLRDDQGFSPPIHRYEPTADVATLVRRHWLPVWDLPAGGETVQRVLQYPVPVLVVGPENAVLSGPRTGLSTQRLAGSGWAVGVLFQPAAGFLLTGRPVRELLDAVVDASSVAAVHDSGLVPALREVMGRDPHDVGARQRAVELVEEALRALLPVDEEGLLVNDLVQRVEDDSDLLRVDQLADGLGMSERTLQRLCARRIGMGPKWLIQRRRLQEVAERLAREGTPDLAGVAADLGYADQAHLTRDFRTVTGLTPGEYAAEPRPPAGG